MKHTIAQQFGLEMVATGLFFEIAEKRYGISSWRDRHAETVLNVDESLTGKCLATVQIQAPFPPQNTKVTAIRGDQRSSDSATEVPLVNQECSPKTFWQGGQSLQIDVPEQNCSPANATEKTQDLADRTFRPK